MILPRSDIGCLVFVKIDIFNDICVSICQRKGYVGSNFELNYAVA